MEKAGVGRALLHALPELIAQRFCLEGMPESLTMTITLRAYLPVEVYNRSIGSMGEVLGWPFLAAQPNSGGHARVESYQLGPAGGSLGGEGRACAPGHPPVCLYDAEAQPFSCLSPQFRLPRMGPKKIQSLSAVVPCWAECYDEKTGSWCGVDPTGPFFSTNPAPLGEPECCPPPILCHLYHLTQVLLYSMGIVFIYVVYI